MENVETSRALADTIATLIIFVPIYVLPTIVAWKRKKKNLVSIFLLNIFLGWTFVGWIGSLVWAFMKDK